MDKKLDDFRLKIDFLDEQILKLLARRIKVVKEIGRYKKEKRLPFLDKARWQELLGKNLIKADSYALSKSFIREIFQIIHKYSLKVQKE